MIQGSTPGPTGTFTRCSRGGSGTANTRRGPSYLRKQNWRTNSAAGPTPPRGRSGHSSATGWPGRSSEEGTYRPARMLIQASHDAPSGLRPQATSAPPGFISGVPPYPRVDRNHQQDLGFAAVRPCRVAGTDWRPGRVYFLTLLEPLAGTTGLWPLPPGRPSPRNRRRTEHHGRLVYRSCRWPGASPRGGGISGRAVFRVRARPVRFLPGHGGAGGLAWHPGGAGDGRVRAAGAGRRPGGFRAAGDGRAPVRRLAA